MKNLAGEKSIEKFAEAYLLEAGSLPPIGGKYIAV